MMSDDWDAKYIPDILPEPSNFKKTLMTRSQLRTLPPVEPLIAGVLSKRVSAVLVGPTGVGKSLMALSWACCVGSGHAWLGNPVERAPVLYLLGEGARGFNARVEAWETAWKTPITDEDVGFSVRPASLMDRGLWSELADEVKDRGAGLVVLDTLSSLAPDADETKDAPTLTRRMADLADDANCTVVLVHHPGWSDSGRTRGGYQFTANTDEIFLLKGGPESALFEMEAKKVKEGAAGGARWLRRQPVADSVVVVYAGEQEVRTYQGDATEIFVRDLLIDGQQRSAAELRDEIMDKFGVGRSQAYERIALVLAKGVIVRCGGTDSRPVYRLSGSTSG